MKKHKEVIRQVITVYSVGLGNNRVNYNYTNHNNKIQKNVGRILTGFSTNVILGVLIKKYGYNKIITNPNTMYVTFSG